MVLGPVLVLAEALAPLKGIVFADSFGSWAARYRGEEGPAPVDMTCWLSGTPIVTISRHARACRAHPGGGRRPPGGLARFVAHLAGNNPDDLALIVQMGPEYLQDGGIVRCRRAGCVTGDVGARSRAGSAGTSRVQSLSLHTGRSMAEVRRDLRTGGDGFARYFEVLVLSWEAMTATQPGGRVVRSDGYVASRAADPVLNNAVILRQDAIDAVRRFFDDSGGHAVWCHADHAVIAAALESAGYRRDTTTRPMLLRLADLADDALSDGSATARVLRGVEPSVVANLNGLRSDFLAGVPGLTAYASDDLQSGLVVIEVGRDVNISAVATRRESRRRGLASAVTRQVLTDSRNRGLVTASLQATPEAERIYARLGFQPVGRWQEWVPREC